MEKTTLEIKEKMKEDTILHIENLQISQDYKETIT